MGSQIGQYRPVERGASPPLRNGPTPLPEAILDASARRGAPRRGALHLYNYTADEIDGCPGTHEPMRAWARALHAAGIDNLVTMSPDPDLYDDQGGSKRSAVDVWVLLPNMYDAVKQRVLEVLRKGDKVWSYAALVQDGYSPKWEIDFQPINYRIVPGFMSYSLNLTGILYWSVDWWTEDPWHNVQTFRNKQGYDFPGEGMLVYPGQPIGLTGVVPSMRLKWIRDGVNDYDYLQLLTKRGCGEEAARSARLVATSWSEWTKDPEVLERERIRLGSALDRSGLEGTGCSP